jgi:site-specific DNA recombinase
VTEAITFDYDTPRSFFRAGLQLLLAEDDNINRSVKVRGGLYTARAKEGRYVYKNPPYGYIKVGEGKARHLEIKENEAAIVKLIYDLYLKEVPLYLIAEKAIEAGFPRTGNVSIQRILSYPLYAGMQYVQPFKTYPGGLFPAIHDPIIDKSTWQMVQNKLAKPEKEKIVVSNEMPLRGVLKCYCGKAVTGAPSRGKLGNYYYYYKCNKTNHLNLSVIKAHDQLRQIFGFMSLPERIVKDIKKNSDRIFEQKIIEDKLLVQEKKKELITEETKLISVEEKWITNQISQETYDRWHSSINQNKRTLEGMIERLSGDYTATHKILMANVEKLTDLEFVYNNTSTLDKQELIRVVFERNLYYQNGMYRTPTMIDLLSHNSQIMSEKGLLVYEKKRENFSIPPLSGMDGTRTRDLLRDRQAF